MNPQVEMRLGRPWRRRQAGLRRARPRRSARPRRGFEPSQAQRHRAANHETRFDSGNGGRWLSASNRVRRPFERRPKITPRTCGVARLARRSPAIVCRGSPSPGLQRPGGAFRPGTSRGPPVQWRSSNRPGTTLSVCLLRATPSRARGHGGACSPVSWSAGCQATWPRRSRSRGAALRRFVFESIAAEACRPGGASLHRDPVCDERPCSIFSPS